MRLESYFGQGMKPAVSESEGSPKLFGSFVFGPAGMVASGQWSEIYRLAYERTIEALRPTPYDWALRASAN